MRVLFVASTVTAVRPPQRWSGGSGVGGALVQSHPVHLWGEGGGARVQYITHQLVCNRQERRIVCAPHRIQRQSEGVNSDNNYWPCMGSHTHAHTHTHKL